MTDNFIQLKKDNILRLGIKDSDGRDTGNVLEFDLEDVELPLKYQTIIEEHKKNDRNLKNQLNIIKKRQDVKGKKLYSKNEEDELRLLEQYFKREAEIYDIFLGENGVKKLLNGRKLGWTTLNEIDNIISKYIMPKLKINMKTIEDKLIKIYDLKSKKEDDTLR